MSEPTKDEMSVQIIGASAAFDRVRRLIEFYGGTADPVFATSDAIGHTDAIAPTVALAEAFLHAAAETGAIDPCREMPGLWVVLEPDRLDAKFLGTINAILLRDRSPHVPDSPVDQGEVRAAALPMPEVKTIAPSPRAERAGGAALMTARDAAKVLGVCEKTLWTLTDEGSMPVVRIGRSVRYDPRDLTRWIDTKKMTAVNSSTPA
jgi:excisionase family DNA binding protein